MIYELSKLPPKLMLGKAGENMATEIGIDISEWAKAYPSATYSIVFQRADKESYPVVMANQGNVLVWKPSATDLLAGYGKLEVRMYDGEVIAKSVVIVTYVTESIEVGEYPDEKAPDWVQDIIDAYVQISPATTERLGLVKVDGTTITADEDGTIHGVEGDYEKLSNLPSINGEELKGDLELPTMADIPTKVSQLANDSKYVKKSELPTVPTKTSDLTNDSGFVTAKDIPTKTSELTNDSGFLTEHQSLKTINGESLIGDGNIEIQGGGGDVSREEFEEVKAQTSTNTKDIDRLYKLTQGQVWDFEQQTESGLQNPPSGAKYESVLEAYGDTKQISYKGTNPCENVDSQIKSGITLDVLPDGGFHVYGTSNASGVTNFVLHHDSNNPLERGKYYINTKGGNSETAFLNMYYGGNLINVTNRLIDMTVEGRNYTIQITVNAGVTVDEIFYLSLYSEQNAPYEPYVGGTPSPNPEYPQEIIAVEELNFNVDGVTHKIIPPFPMHKIGDYADKLDVVNGVWERNIETIHLKEENNVALQSISAAGLANIRITLNNAIYYGGDAVLRSWYKNSHFTYDQSNIANATREGWLLSTDHVLYLRFNEQKVKTADEAKAFIATNDVTISVVASSKETTLISAEDKAFLDTLQGIDVKNITVTDQNGNDVSYLVEYIVKLNERSVATNE